MHEMTPKSLKMDAHSESRQGVLAAASVNFAAVKYILTTMKTKFTVARILRIKGSAEQPEPTRCSEISLTTAKTCCPNLLEHEILGYKKGCNNHF